MPALRRALWGGIIATLAVAVLRPADKPASKPKVDYARDVKPVLEKYCYDCHGPKQQLNGLRLDRKDAVMKQGALSGQIVIPFDGEGSRIVRMIGGIDGMPMPIGDPKPTREEVNIIKTWIDQGAVWPDDPAPARTSH
jgi:hypothetical protein